MSSYQNMRLHNPIYFTFYLPVYYYKIYLFFLLTVKNLKMNEATSCNFTKNLFVSYCHRNKLIVHRIADELQNLNYKLWIDRDLHAGNKLYTEIEKGMQESNLVICFISKSYCESEDCVKELSFAHEKRKNILPIMLEREVSNGVGFLLSNILKAYLSSLIVYSSCYLVLDSLLFVFDFDDLFIYLKLFEFINYGKSFYMNLI